MRNYLFVLGPGFLSVTKFRSFFLPRNYGPSSRAQPRNNMGPPRLFFPHGPSKIPNDLSLSTRTAPMDSDGEEAQAPPAAGRLKGSPERSVDADMREMGKTAAWSVSSCKAGNDVAALRDDNLDTYWQSVRPDQPLVEKSILFRGVTGTIS
jgi:hypothetical protein